ncbi:hypothetical protein YC2023_023072 [Brassica napus]
MTSFPARSNDDEFSDEGDRLYKLRRTRRSLSLRLRNANKEAVEMEHEFILKIDEVGELFEEARGILNKNSWLLNTFFSLIFFRHLLIRMLSPPRTQTILVDGALREGELLIPLPSFEILVFLTFSSPST